MRISSTLGLQLMSHTKVVSTLRDGAAVHFPEAIADIDDLERVRDDLVLVFGCNILGKRASQFQEDLVGEWRGIEAGLGH